MLHQSSVETTSSFSLKKNISYGKLQTDFFILNYLILTHNFKSKHYFQQIKAFKKMEKLIFCILCFLTIVGCDDSTAQTKLSPDDFEKLIKTDKNVQLVDVRSPQEVANGHLEKAVNINIADADFDVKMSQLDKTKPIAVYCGVGGRSGKAAAKLTSLGFTKIYDLQGGITAWKGQNKAVVK
jgi:rhodanese-related sulfurtransferase